MKVETAAIPTAWSYEIKPGNLILHQNSGMDIWMITGVDETEEEESSSKSSRRLIPSAIPLWSI